VPVPDTPGPEANTGAGAPADAIAAVVIGRNEGARLLGCLDSLAGRVARIVYVDSGSTDGSAAAARARGAEVVDLDLARPFTAARARNAGLDRLRETGARPVHVQFVDGDCSVVPGWIETARAFLDSHPEVAAVCGRRRERHPEASVYNRLCDWEWDTPVGEAKACGGDALIRMAALDAVGGYDPALIAGEEPEMCVRLRARGWRIRRLDAEMTLHDAAMTRFGQFWQRMRRSGHAYAEGAALHGAPPERHCVAETRLAYPAQVLRLALRDGGSRAAWDRAALLTAGKFAEAQGALEYHWRRRRGRPAGLIEYK